MKAMLLALLSVVPNLFCNAQNQGELLSDMVSKICIGLIPKDTNHITTPDEFTKDYASFSFRDCLTIDSSNNLLNDMETTPGFSLNEIGGYYGVLVLKNGMKIPITVSSSPCFFTLDKNNLYLLNEKKHQEWIKFVSQSMESSKFKISLGKLSDIVSEICVGINKTDTTNDILSEEDFVKRYTEFSFRNCYKIAEDADDENVFSDVGIKHQMILWKGHKFGILILKGGTKVPIKISHYGGFFSILTREGDTHHISEKKLTEWENIVNE
ncbi:hypothetical protein ACQ33O_06525 [Ferruginibacter sp. SUN002]|uniref:hypothetical protein n=1 Tax=Ferruginibacter sp. SUN002 TaxID=2937789 RepID=UPI003D368958